MKRMVEFRNKVEILKKDIFVVKKRFFGNIGNLIIFKVNVY